MTWTSTTLTIKDAAGTTQPVIAYTDGTNFSFAHPLLDNTGAIIAPATSGNQATANTSLSTIATAVQAAIPAGTNTIGAITNGGQVVTGSTITRPANTTAYVAGYLVANSTTAGSVTYPTIAAARGTNIVSVATRCILKKTGTSLTNAIFRVHFYNAQPSVSNGDGAAWLTGSSNYLGFFDVTCTQVFTDAAMGVGIPGSGSMMTFTPASSSANLYFLIEARAAYTPVSGEVFTVSLEVN